MARRPDPLVRVIRSFLRDDQNCVDYLTAALRSDVAEDDDEWLRIMRDALSDIAGAKEHSHYDRYLEMAGDILHLKELTKALAALGYQLTVKPSNDPSVSTQALPPSSDPA